MIDYTRRLTVFLISSGEPSREACRRRLEAQDCTFSLDEIVDVSPMDRAFQEMLDRCTTELYVQVDADMLLEPSAIRNLVEAIDRERPEVAVYCGWLWGDSEERPILGVKIYRHAITRRFPYASSLSCEVPQLEAMRGAGYQVSVQTEPQGRNGCLGLHFSLQTPEMAFRRQQRLAWKYRTRPYMAWWERYPQKLLERWRDDPTRINMAAALGAISGLSGPTPVESEADARETPPDYRRLMGSFTSALEEEAKVGPSELTLYITDRCNAACAGCWRAVNAPETPDMDPALARDVLSTFPSLRSVCIAGFGEPLMHPRLGEIIQACRERGVFSGIITNGILLLKRLEEVIQWMPGMITVSVNATTAEEHEAAQGVPRAWELTLAGIRSAVAAGLDVGVSYIVRRQNAERIDAFLDLSEALGVRFVNLVNLLPHGETEESFRASVITPDCPEVAVIERARKHPAARRVLHWPTLITLDSLPPRRCNSPYRLVGVDVRGFVTTCRRMATPDSFGALHYTRDDVWRDQELVQLRLAMQGDRELPQACKTCFGCWSG